MRQSRFVLKYNNKVGVSYDGVPADRGQCVQLVELKWLEVDDKSRKEIPLYPDAATYWEKGVKFCRKITHVPGKTFPKRGDVVVFDRKLPGSGGHGHIDIALNDGNSKKMDYVGFDSNWIPLKATKVRHSLTKYSHVLGYLRIK